MQDSARLMQALDMASDTARIEVQCLLQHVLNVPRAYLLTHPERRLNTPEQARYNELLQRRISGEPIAYLLGEREFFGLIFKVTPATLIPRPETELLVELALLKILKYKPCRVLDLGTGSGAIALAIAHECPDVEVLACDTSVVALEVARENAERLNVTQISFVLSDWFAALDAKRFDIIVANPPYIAAGDPHLVLGDVRFEPASALISGSDGLYDIRHIISHGGKYLESNGWLLLEHGYDQAVQVRELLMQAGYSEIFSAQDLAGIARVSGGRIT